MPTLRLLLYLTLATLALPALAQNREKKPDRPQPPTRAFDALGAPKFTRLDGQLGADAVGDFVIGPDYVAAPETKVVEGVPQGVVKQFQMPLSSFSLVYHHFYMYRAQ